MPPSRNSRGGIVQAESESKYEHETRSQKDDMKQQHHELRTGSKTRSRDLKEEVSEGARELAEVLEEAEPALYSLRNRVVAAGENLLDKVKESEALLESEAVATRSRATLLEERDATISSRTTKRSLSQQTRDLRERMSSPQSGDEEEDVDIEFDDDEEEAPAEGLSGDEAGDASAWGRTLKAKGAELLDRASGVGQQLRSRLRGAAPQLEGRIQQGVQKVRGKLERMNRDEELPSGGSEEEEDSQGEEDEEESGEPGMLAAGVSKIRGAAQETGSKLRGAVQGAKAKIRGAVEDSEETVQESGLKERLSRGLRTVQDKASALVSEGSRRVRGSKEEAEEQVEQVSRRVRGARDQAADQLEDTSADVKSSARSSLRSAQAKGEELLEDAKAKGADLKAKGQEVLEDAKSTLRSRARSGQESLEDAKFKGEDVLEDAKAKSQGVMAGAKAKGQKALESAKAKMEDVKYKGQEALEGAKAKAQDAKAKAQDAKSKSREALEDAKAKGQEAMEDAKSTLRSRARSGARSAEEEGESIAEQASSLKERVARGAKELRSKATNLVKSSQSSPREDVSVRLEEYSAEGSPAPVVLADVDAQLKEGVRQREKRANWPLRIIGALAAIWAVAFLMQAFAPAPPPPTLVDRVSNRLFGHSTAGVADRMEHGWEKLRSEAVPLGQMLAGQRFEPSFTDKLRHTIFGTPLPTSGGRIAEGIERVESKVYQAVDSVEDKLQRASSYAKEHLIPGAKDTLKTNADAINYHRTHGLHDLKQTVRESADNLAGLTLEKAYAMGLLERPTFGQRVLNFLNPFHHEETNVELVQRLTKERVMHAREGAHDLKERAAAGIHDARDKLAPHEPTLGERIRSHLPGHSPTVGEQIRSGAHDIKHGAYDLKDRAQAGLNDLRSRTPDLDDVKEAINPHRTVGQKIKDSVLSAIPGYKPSIKQQMQDGVADLKDGAYDLRDRAQAGLDDLRSRTPDLQDVKDTLNPHRTVGQKLKDSVLSVLPGYKPSLKQQVQDGAADLKDGAYDLRDRAAAGLDELRSRMPDMADIKDSLNPHRSVGQKIKDSVLSAMPGARPSLKQQVQDGVQDLQDSAYELRDRAQAGVNDLRSRTPDMQDVKDTLNPHRSMGQKIKDSVLSAIPGYKPSIKQQMQDGVADLKDGAYDLRDRAQAGLDDLRSRTPDMDDIAARARSAASDAADSLPSAHRSIGERIRSHLPGGHKHPIDNIGEQVRSAGADLRQGAENLKDRAAAGLRDVRSNVESATDDLHGNPQNLYHHGTAPYGTAAYDLRDGHAISEDGVGMASSLRTESAYSDVEAIPMREVQSEISGASLPLDAQKESLTQRAKHAVHDVVDSIKAHLPGRPHPIQGLHRAEDSIRAGSQRVESTIRSGTQRAADSIKGGVHSAESRLNSGVESVKQGARDTVRQGEQLADRARVATDSKLHDVRKTAKYVEHRVEHNAEKVAHRAEEKYHDLRDEIEYRTL